MAWHRYAAELGCTVGEAKQKVTSDEFSKWKRYRLVEPNNPPVTAWQLAICTSAICNSLGGETVPEDFLIEPFEIMYKDAVQDGEFDDDEGEYVTVDPPREPGERRARPIVDLDS